VRGDVDLVGPPERIVRHLQSAIVGHGADAHARGTSLDDPAAVPIYETTEWEEPELRELTPPLVIDGSGTDGFILRCEYDNYTDTRVRFGEGVDDEMCFMMTMYWPSRGFSLMIRPGF
jgi:hypothetical protein